MWHKNAKSAVRHKDFDLWCGRLGAESEELDAFLNAVFGRALVGRFRVAETLQY
jgi:hypothetical protein